MAFDEAAWAARKGGVGSRAANDARRVRGSGPGKGSWPLAFGLSFSFVFPVPGIRRHPPSRPSGSISHGTSSSVGTTTSSPSASVRHAAVPPLSWVRGDTPTPPRPYHSAASTADHRIDRPQPRDTSFYAPPAGPSQVARGGGPGSVLHPSDGTQSHTNMPPPTPRSPLLPPGDGAEAADFILDSGLTGSVVTPAAAARYRLPPLSSGVCPDRRRCAPTRR